MIMMSLLIGILHILNDDPDRLRKRKKHGIVIPEKEGFSNAVLWSKIWTSPKKAEGKALIQVRGFGYENDGSLRENHRVILRPDRIRLLL